MAKSAIRKLKARRFWRWLCCEVDGKPEPKQPIALDRRRSRRARRDKRRRTVHGKPIILLAWGNGFDRPPREFLAASRSTLSLKEHCEAIGRGSKGD